MRGRENGAAYPPENRIQGLRLQPAVGRYVCVESRRYETDPNAERGAATDAVEASPDLDELYQLARLRPNGVRGSMPTHT